MDYTVLSYCFLILHMHIVTPTGVSINIYLLSTILQFFCNSSLFIEYIIYDDACHLKRYACNPSRANKTDTTKHISSCHIVVDKFHFPGHVDLWCKEHCNPNKLEELNNVKLCIL